jgi:hypothetical protein
MTTIAARRTPTGMWTIAADTQETREGEDSGDMKRTCKKLFRFYSSRYKGEIIVATAGESSPGLAFIEWLRDGRSKFPEWLRERDIACLVIAYQDRAVRLFEYDQFGIPTEIEEQHYAIGTGAIPASVALDMGACVEEAVRRAHKYDPYTGPDVKVEALAPRI